MLPRPALRGEGWGEAPWRRACNAGGSPLPGTRASRWPGRRERSDVSAIKTYIAGHRGLVGSALVRRYRSDPQRTLLTRTHAELDLTDPEIVAVSEEADQLIIQLQLIRREEMEGILAKIK